MLVGGRRGETVPSQFNHPGREIGIQCREDFQKSPVQVIQQADYDRLIKWKNQTNI